MVALIKTLQVILALSLLIFIHELGHFAWARIFGIKVEKFYLFFDIGGKALLRFRKGDTEFGIGWLPLGGYCKIAGMVDESLDTESLKKEPSEWEFRSKPAPQRFMVMLGGVLNNFIFAILVYIAIMAIWGQSYIQNKGSQIYVNPLAYEMGFRNGDEILSLDDYVPDNFGSLQADLARRDVNKAVVKRGNDTINIYIDHSMISRVLNSSLMFDLAIPFVIDSIPDTSPNRLSGLVRNDRLVAVGGRPVEFVQESRPILDSLRGGITEVTVVRQADTLGIPVQVDTAGRLGVILQVPGITVREYSLAEAIPAGLKLTWSSVTGYLKDLRLLATPSSGAYKSVGSFIAIGQVFPSAWDWYQFMYILALLSIMLGIMNLIPIPGLDGGHILFLLYEMLSGRKPSERFLYIAQLVGMALLVALMILAFGNDIGRLIH
ncbi:MAG: RIP metalloprotease RseP [Bacteroidales bacterium]|nr:RIP metalloprotease RseP [Bacteroidales bacterium]